MKRGSPQARVGLAALAVALALTAAVNGLVRWISSDGPFLLDPRHLPSKSAALLAYARHRAGCALFDDDGDVAEHARSAARAAGVEPELFEAVVLTESGAHAHRISPTGAMGPAQLTASTARMLGVDDPFEPQSATRGGARYLRQLLERYRGNRALAVAAYNAGPNAVVDAVPRNGETELYVPRVLARYQALKAAHPSRNTTSTPLYMSMRLRSPARASSKELVMPRSGTPGSARRMATKSASGSRCSRCPRPAQLK